MIVAERAGFEPARVNDPLRVETRVPIGRYGYLSLSLMVTALLEILGVNFDNSNVARLP